MAVTQDYFEPGATADPTAGIADPAQYENLVGQWNEFLADPRGRGALLQAGLTMMQPRGFGDTVTGQVGRAIGSGGEAIGRVEAADRANLEASSRQELRGAQANLAGARAETSVANANTAATRAAAAGDRLAYLRETEQGRTDRHNLGQQVRLSGLYQQAVNQINQQNSRNARQNADPLNRGQPTLPILPIPSMQDWLRSNPTEVQGMFPSVPGSTTPPATPQPSGGTGLQEGQSVPAAQRVVGQTYNTPRGPMAWTGTGWVQPGGQTQ